MSRSTVTATMLMVTTLCAAPALADSGPVIQLPPDESAPAAPLDKEADPTLERLPLSEAELGTGRRTSIGGYGEAWISLQDPQGGGTSTELRLRRVVLFFGHRFNDWLSVYSELEVEDVKDFEIEQTYVELKPLSRFGVRVGLVLLPLGIINGNHEPPTFNGVDRPMVDQLIIPTTWRELGIGVFGTIVPGLHYQAYVIDGADGSLFTPDGGIGPGLSRGFNINTENVAATGRVEWNGTPGLDAGVGFYFGGANNSAANLEGIHVGLVEGDVRFSRGGLGLRAEFASVVLDGADKLTDHLRINTSPNAEAIGSLQLGVYAEAGYDVLHLVRATEQALVVFARYEYVDTRAALPAVVAPLPSEAQQYYTVGLTWRPRLEVAFKLEYRRQTSGDASAGADRFMAGIGFMY